MWTGLNGKDPFSRVMPMVDMTIGLPPRPGADHYRSMLQQITGGILILIKAGGEADP